MIVHTASQAEIYARPRAIWGCLDKTSAMHSTFG